MIERLPRGRHKLARDEVVGSQRERMLRALADTMAEKGYVATTVADVLSRAGVSRQTFYEQFTDKQDCFMSAYETAVDHILERMQERGPSPFFHAGDRFERALGSYLDALASEPAFARLFLLEVYAAGPAALERRARAQQRFVELVQHEFAVRTPHDRFAAEALVAAISAMVTARLAVHDVDGLRRLHGPLAALARRLFVTPDSSGAGTRSRDR